MFEWVATPSGAQATVCAGGRFDGLIEQIGGKSAAAAGFAMGIERILALLQEDGDLPAGTTGCMRGSSGRNGIRHVEFLAENLRDFGLRVVLHCGGSFSPR